MRETQIIIILVSVAIIAAFIAGRISRNVEIQKANAEAKLNYNRCSLASEKIQNLEFEIYKMSEFRNDIERKYSVLQNFVNAALLDWKKQGALLPYLLEWSERLQIEYDEMIERDLQPKRPREVTAIKQAKEARAEARKYKKEAERLRPQLALYESLAPWLVEYTDLTVEEILAGIQEEKELKEFYKSGDDPVSLFVPKSEWGNLTESMRNQLALDRYWQGSRRRTAWTAGIQYERFIGYHHEAKGYKVEYHGANLGRDDLGIDLVCVKDEEVRVVQCKRLSSNKGIPVRENVIAQVYGAARYYTMEHSLLVNAIPVLYTSYECSVTARRFAQLLGVRLFENVGFQPYPCIKCNISRIDGQRIYHLPFDQQYDDTIIGDSEGDFYAMTVAQAEHAGFRRAYRWSGKG